MRYAIVAVIIVIALSALFGVGYGVGVGMTAIGLGSWGGILWAEGLAIGLIILVVDRGFRRWLGANQMLAVAGILSLTSVAALAHWYETGSRAGLWIGVGVGIIAVLTFIKYTCRWHNWCHRAGPHLRRARNRAAGFVRGPGANFAVWSAGWLKKGFKFIWNNLRIILTVLTGAGLACSLIYGKLWVSAWWWALALLLLVLPYKKLWREVVVPHWKKLSLGQQAMLASGAVLGLGWCLYLSMKWLKGEPVFNFHIPFWGTNGVGMVAAVAVTALVVLSIMMRTSPKKPTPAHP